MGYSDKKNQLVKKINRKLKLTLLIVANMSRA